MLGWQLISIDQPLNIGQPGVEYVLRDAHQEAR